MYSIYVLIDPRDDAIRYVGITNDVYARFSQHLRGDSSNISKNAWVQELKDANMMLIMRTIDTAETFEQAREREMHWIKHHMKQGNNLLNIDGVRSITFNQFMAFFGQEGDMTTEEECDVVDNEVTNAIPAKTQKASFSGKKSMSKEEAAQYLECSVKDVEKLIKNNKIKMYGTSKTNVLASSVKDYTPSRKKSTKVSA